MATNTNYTTKTAALKATKADMRQVQVSKKLTSKEVWIDDAEGVSTNVLELIGDAQDAATQAASGALAEAKGELTEAIGAVSDKVDNMKMGIDIGTDISEAPEDDPESGITNAPAAYSGVSKLNFRGEYVTVVEDPVTKEITLWLNKSTAYPEFKSAVRTAGTNITDTKSVTVYTHDTDTFVIGTAGGTKTAYLATDGSNTNFSTSTWTLKSSIDTSATATTGDTFRVSSTQSLFVRETYEGASSSWMKIDLGTKAGKTYDISKNFADKNSDPFTGGSDKSVTSGAITVMYSAMPLTSAHAPNGRVPGTSECRAQIKVDWDKLLTKDGGTAKIEMAFDSTKNADGTDKTEPIADNIVALANLFFSEKKASSITETPTVDYDAITKTDAISGLKYAKEGTTVSVGVTGITNTQWKVSNTTGTRLTVKASNGTAVSKTVSQLNETSGKGTTHSDAVYATKENVIVTAKTESEANRGTCVVTITPVGFDNGTAKTVNLAGFWSNFEKVDGNNKYTSSGTVEYFFNEAYRTQAAPNAGGSYDSASSVSTAKTTVNGTAYNSAVVQYGYLKHPSKAATDIDGTSYSTLTADAAYMRVFSTGSVGTTFSIEGAGLTSSGVSVYWYENNGGKWHLLCKDGVKGDAKCAVSGNKITRSIDTGGGEANVKDVHIAIVMTSAAGNISPITFTRS